MIRVAKLDKKPEMTQAARVKPNTSTRGSPLEIRVIQALMRRGMVVWDRAPVTPKANITKKKEVPPNLL